MQCLTYNECAEWCSRHDFPTDQNNEPDLQSAPFHFAEFVPPADSGRKVWFSNFLYSLLTPSPETLIQLGNWSVWPSSQHMPLFTSFRQACGERRPLIEAPAHLIAENEADDAISVVAVSLLFVWDCYILSGTGRDAVFISHDEFGWFSSRDASVAESVSKRLQEVLKQ
jgi:hypothetical protein